MIKYFHALNSQKKTFNGSQATVKMNTLSKLNIELKHKYVFSIEVLLRNSKTWPKNRHMGVRSIQTPFDITTHSFMSMRQYFVALWHSLIIIIIIMILGKIGWHLITDVVYLSDFIALLRFFEKHLRAASNKHCARKLYYK